MAFYDPTMFEVHVLLVDHDMNSLYETTRLLQFNSYKVTPVDDACLASSMLSKGKTMFNVVMVEVQPSRSEGFKLMNEAVRMGLTVIVISTSATPMLAKCAIEEGAFLFMRKPPPHEELKYIWQHVLREISRKNKEKAKSHEETSTHNHRNLFSFMSKGEKSPMNAINGEKGRGEIFSLSSNNDNINKVAALQCTSMKPKMCTEWTTELHEKFMDAVKILGDGRCFPKDILEVMNVEGLTRMQVASHLQKCRHGWKPSYEKSSVRRQKAPKPPNPTSNKGKKYGILPCMARGSQPQFPSENTQNDEQVDMASSSNANTKNPIIISDSDFMLNMRHHGTWVEATFANNDKKNNSSNNNNMNEIFLDKNFISGHMMVGPADHMLQPHEASFNYAATDDGLMIGNNLNNEFDLDQVFLGQAYDIGSASAPSGANDAAMDSAGFGNSWVTDFSREI